MKKKVLGFVLAMLIGCLMGGNVFAAGSVAHVVSSIYDGDDAEWWKNHENEEKSLPDDLISTSYKSMSDNTSGYRHNNRFTQGGYTIKRGVDVSQWNGSINWNAAKNDGVEFAFVRVGYRGYGPEGTLNADSRYGQNLAGANAAGIPVGVYIFSQAISIAEAEAEANYVIDRIGGYNISLPIVIDFEYASAGGSNMGRLYNARLTKEQATSICKAFCQKVQSRGYRGMVYANDSMLSSGLNAWEISSSYQVWLAHYTYETSYQGMYNFWQFRRTGKIAGIPEAVDVNFWYDDGTSGGSGWGDVVGDNYTVKFDGNGATGGKMKPMKDCDASEYYWLSPNKFTRTGYEFVGWNTKKNGKGKDYEDEGMIYNLGEHGDTEIVLYAQWKMEDYKIEYVLNGGINDKSNPTSYNVKSETIILKDAKKTGYIFEGWYSDKYYTRRIKKITQGSEGDYKLYAKFNPIQYTIKYMGHAADSGAVAPNKCSYDKEYIIRKNKFVKRGYTFKGWNTKKDGTGTSFAVGQKVKNLTIKDGTVIKLYAMWDVVNYTITYNLDGGVNNKKNPATYTRKDSITLEAPKKTGYTFMGWYKDASFTTKVKKIRKGTTGNINLYAKWRANKYVIHYMINGGTTGRMSDMTCTYDQTYTLSENKFVKKGYRFVGWNTKADGSGDAYKDMQEISNLRRTPNANCYLFAQWEKIETVQ